MKKLTIIEPILFGFMFCLFTTMPLEQQLIYQKLCLREFNQTYCNTLHNSKNIAYKSDQDALQKFTAEWEIRLNMIRTAPAIITTLIFTKLFDKVGRKKVMIMPMIGGTLLSISLIINTYFMKWPVEIMLIGTFLEGMFGQFAAILASVFAYTADVSTRESRTKRTLLLESMIFIAGVSSTCISGVLVQFYGFLPAFMLLFAMYFFQISYWFFLKESYSPPLKEKFSTSVYKIVCSKNFLRGKLFLEAFQVAFPKRNGQRKNLLSLLICFIIFVFYFVGFNNVTILYILRSPINFSPSKIGFFLAECNALKFIGASFINYVLLHRLNVGENWALVIYCVCFLGLSISFVFVDEAFQVYIAVIWSLGLGAGPGVIRGKLSKIVQLSEQGQIFSMVACTEVLSSLLASLIFNGIYSKTVDFAPNTIYFAYIGLCSIPALLVGLLFHWEKQFKCYEDLGQIQNKDAKTIEGKSHVES